MKTKNKIISFLMSFSIAFVAFSGSALAKSKPIKFAAVAPEGSTWMKLLRQWNKEVTKKTEGRVRFKFYAGGVMGDEGAVLRKMKSGQLGAAAFTGVGLGKIVPSARVMELPFLFKTHEEVDHVINKLTPVFDRAFKKKGFVNLGWAETGFVYIFSNKPVRKIDDLKGVKMWMWKGDPLVKASFDVLNIVPQPLDLTDVLTSLQTKLIDGVYAPPLGAIALQWNTKVKYMLEQQMGFSNGAMLISAKSWTNISKADQKVLTDLSKIYARKIVESVRVDNAKSLKTIKKQGIVFTSPDAADMKSLDPLTQKVYKSLVGKLYTQKMLDAVQKLVKEKRK